MSLANKNPQVKRKLHYGMGDARERSDELNEPPVQSQEV